MFSRRSQFETRHNALTATLLARRAAGLPVCDLTVSNPTQVGLHLPRTALQSALVAGLDGPYEPEPLGLWTARRAVADYVTALQVRGATGWAPVPPEHILLTASTSEAYSLLLMLLCDPGDEVLVPQPSYPLLPHLGQLHDVAMRPYASHHADGWHIDLAALRALVTPRTRAIVAVSPNNPTGAVLSAAEAAELAAICREHGLALVVDEVFAETVQGRAPAALTTVAGQADCLTFALGGLSKTCLQPQLKLAWTLVSGPQPQRDAALGRLEMMADTWLSVATPVQRALPGLLGLVPLLQAPLRARLDHNLGQLEALLGGGPIDVLRPQGGWSALLRLPQRPDDRDWAEALLDEHGVLVHPGWLFDLPGDGWLVVSLIAHPDVLAAGASALGAAQQ